MLAPRAASALMPSVPPETVTLTPPFWVPVRLALLPVSSSRPEPVLNSPPEIPFGLPAMAPAICVKPVPPTVMPPMPEVPMLVLEPKANVGIAPRAALFVIVSALA